MPTTATTDQPTAAGLTAGERDVLRAVGCALTDGEIAAALGIPVLAVVGHVERILGKLGLRDRAAAIVHAFDRGLVVPGRGPRAHPAPRVVVSQPAGPRLRLSVLGPLRAWQGGQPLDLGPVRQQAVLAALALRPDRTVGQQELRDGVWGTEPPAGNVVQVYVYRLRKILHGGVGPEPVIRRDRSGYRFVGSAVEVDVARLERHVTAAKLAEGAGDLAEGVRACSRALAEFDGEPLAGLPGPYAELERLRLAERRMALAQWKLDWQLRLGQHAEAVAELSALVAAQPQNEPVAAMLMRALHRSGRRAEALAVFTRTYRQLADDLGLGPGDLLRQAQLAVLHGDDAAR